MEFRWWKLPQSSLCKTQATGGKWLTKLLTAFGMSGKRASLSVDAMELFICPLYLGAASTKQYLSSGSWKFSMASSKASRRFSGHSFFSFLKSLAALDSWVFCECHSFRVTQMYCSQKVQNVPINKHHRYRPPWDKLSKGTLSLHFQSSVLQIEDL